MIVQRAGNNNSFGVLCVAKYHVPNGSKTAEVAIYQLEPRDIPVVEKLYAKAKRDTLIPKYLNKPEMDRSVWSGLVSTTLHKALASIKMAQKYIFKEEPSARFIAVSNKKVCGILTGNMPKIDQKCQKVSFTWTGKPNETELNWIATYPPNKNDKTKGIGAAITNEFFNFAQKIPALKIIRVKSAVFSEGFYKKTGFTFAKPKVVQCETQQTPRELAILANNDHYEPESTTAVYSMQISKEKAAQKFREFAEKTCRDEGDKHSVDLATVIKI